MTVRRERASTLPALFARGLVRFRLLSGVALAGALASSCSPGAPPKVQAHRELAPQWQDVFDGTPEVFGVVRPQAIKRDAVYGAFFKNVVRMAQARTPMRGVTALEALEGCDEIVIGLRKDGSGDDAAMVFVGVPASLDPQKMTDVGGRPLLRLVDARAKVPEYEWSELQNAAAGSLFVLPDRTWVGVIGEARARARQAFASPFGRPAPKTDAAALATVRLDAAALFRGPRFAKSALLGPLTRKLSAVTLALRPGKGGVEAALQYEDEDASAWAEMHVKRVVEELAHREKEKAGAPLAWLESARIGREGRAVVLQVAVPARLLEELPNASGHDLTL
jgi:hypothetical protein